MGRSRRHFATAALGTLALSVTAGPAYAHHGRVVVGPGDSIQAAVDQAAPGQTILVRGAHRENVAITTDGIRLIGRGARLEPPAAPQSNFCSNPGQPATIGICVAGQFDPNTGEVTDTIDDVTVKGFETRGFPDSGIEAFGASDATFAHNVARDDDEYGITAFVSSGTRMVSNRVSGAEEAGFYIGDSPQADATVRGNVATDSRFGILFRNSEGGSIARNLLTGNCVGVMALSGIEGLPGLAGGLSVRHNAIWANNRPCEESEEGPAISGVGVALAGTHDSRVTRNLITGNVPAGPTAFSGGVAVVTDFVGTPPQDNVVRHNLLLGNAPDLFWDGTGSGNRFRRNLCRTSEPPGLC